MAAAEARRAAPVRTICFGVPVDPEVRTTATASGSPQRRGSRASGRGSAAPAAVSSTGAPPSKAAARASVARTRASAVAGMAPSVGGPTVGRTRPADRTRPAGQSMNGTVAILTTMISANSWAYPSVTRASVDRESA